MASFSDPPEPARLGFVPPQNEAERFLMTRVEELCRTAESRGFPRATGFLSDREQSLAWAAVCRAGCGCTRWEGGYPGAERRVLCIEPAGSWALEPVAALRIAAQGTPPPAHRDYLGALLGLGIQRTCLGDILPDPDAAGVVYAFVLEDKADFLAAELTQAGRCPVRTERCDAVPDRVLAAPERTLRQATVPSLRADAVLGAMMNTSRALAAGAIAAGRVEINHLPLRSAHEPVYENDLFTVRGAGRWRLQAVGGKSRKDRIFITFFQY